MKICLFRLKYTSVRPHQRGVPPSGSSFCLVADGNHILAAESIRKYQRAVLKFFLKILEKISFFNTHIRAKMQSNASYWGDSLRCGQTEVYFKVSHKNFGCSFFLKIFCLTKEWFKNCEKKKVSAWYRWCFKKRTKVFVNKIKRGSLFWKRIIYNSPNFSFCK